MTKAEYNAVRMIQELYSEISDTKYGDVLDSVLDALEKDFDLKYRNKFIKYISPYSGDEFTSKIWCYNICTDYCCLFYTDLPGFEFFYFDSNTILLPDEN